MCICRRLLHGARGFAEVARCHSKLMTGRDAADRGRAVPLEALRRPLGPIGDWIVARSLHSLMTGRDVSGWAVPRRACGGRSTRTAVRA